MISSPSFMCSTRSYNYDTCVLNTNLKHLEHKCLPIFMEINESKDSTKLPRCKTFNESQDAFNIFQSVSTACNVPCTQVKVGIVTTPVSFLYNILEGRGLNAENAAYYVTIPQEVCLSEFEESYSFISFIGNIGGWMGLLIGFSITSFFDLLMKTLKIQEKAKTFLSRGLLMLGCSMIAVIFVSSCLKLGEKKTGSDIKIVSDYKNMSISLCSLESVYSSRNEYVGEDRNFWNNNTKLYQKISKLEVWFKNGEKNILFDASKDLSSDFMDNSINILTGGKYLETCHTLELNFNNRIDQIKIIAKKELICYVHISGQMLHQNSRQGFSIIDLSTTYLNTDNVNIYSSSTSFKMNILNQTEVIQSSYTDGLTYDKCVLSWISQQANVKSSFLNPTEITNFTSGLKNDVLKRIKHIFASTEFSNTCEYPTNQLNIKYSKEKLIEKWHYQKKTMDHKNISQDFYLKFPDFAVLNKVFNCCNILWDFIPKYLYASVIIFVTYDLIH